MPMLHSTVGALPKQVFLVFVASILVVGVSPAAAQTETVLYTFCSQANCTDGAWPTGDLVIDASGNLYGAARGGSPECSFYGCGVLFQLAPDGTEAVLRSFSLDDPTDGVVPSGGLIRDATGNLFGTTYEGGYYSKHVCKVSGCGLVYQLSPSGTETVIYSFAGSTAGAFPWGGLVMDAQGNFYGSTWGLGPSGHTSGSVFKVTSSGVEILLHKFGAKGDGFINIPHRLVVDGEGNIYGTTDYGGVKGRASKHGGCGRGCGTVFEISATGVLTLLHTFTGFTHQDGAQPQAGLIIDDQGSLYGTTYFGGLYGYGTVFRLALTGEETILYNFTGGTDGAFPQSSLVMDAKGNLYGTTWRGGTYTFGTVYQVTSSGVETVLHSFSGGADGGWPQEAGLVLDDQNNIYGTTPLGGSLNGICSEGGGVGCGVLFKLSW